jgi:hypothetical protein
VLPVERLGSAPGVAALRPVYGGVTWGGGGGGGGGGPEQHNAMAKGVE